jgi:F-type H+-transporting ATPase subunit delta
MSTRTAATRYAKALLDVAGADAPTIERSLTAFVDLSNSHSELRQALLSPSVPAAGKRGVATAIAGRIGMAPVGVKLLELLADRDRFHLLDDLLTVFRERLLEQQKVVKAELRSAVPLPAEAVTAIEARLSAVTGRNV